MFSFFSCSSTYYVFTHGYGLVVTSAYPVEEVSISHSGCIILKTLKIVPTASLLSIEYTRVEWGQSLPSHVRTYKAWVEKYLLYSVASFIYLNV
jgi:hypothetical protein